MNNPLHFMEHLLPHPQPAPNKVLPPPIKYRKIQSGRGTTGYATPTKTTSTMHNLLFILVYSYKLSIFLYLDQIENLIYYQNIQGHIYYSQKTK